MDLVYGCIQYNFIKSGGYVPGHDHITLCSASRWARDCGIFPQKYSWTQCTFVHLWYFPSIIFRNRHEDPTLRLCGATSGWLVTPCTESWHHQRIGWSRIYIQITCQSVRESQSSHLFADSWLQGIQSWSSHSYWDNVWGYHGMWIEGNWCICLSITSGMCLWRSRWTNSWGFCTSSPYCCILYVHCCDGSEVGLSGPHWHSS